MTRRGKTTLSREPFKFLKLFTNLEKPKGSMKSQIRRQWSIVRDFTSDRFRHQVEL